MAVVLLRRVESAEHVATRASVLAFLDRFVESILRDGVHDDDWRRQLRVVRRDRVRGKARVVVRAVAMRVGARALSRRRRHGWLLHRSRRVLEHVERRLTLVRERCRLAERLTRLLAESDGTRRRRQRRARAAGLRQAGVERRRLRPSRGLLVRIRRRSVAGRAERTRRRQRVRAAGDNEQTAVQSADDFQTEVNERGQRPVGQSSRKRVPLEGLPR